MVKANSALLLHVDPPIKEIIRSLNEEIIRLNEEIIRRQNDQGKQGKLKEPFVLRHLEDDPNKIVVSKTLDGKNDGEKTVLWLQEKIDKHLEDISFK